MLVSQKCLFQFSCLLFFFPFCATTTPTYSCEAHPSHSFRLVRLRAKWAFDFIKERGKFVSIAAHWNRFQYLRTSKYLGTRRRLFDQPSESEFVTIRGEPMPHQERADDSVAQICDAIRNMAVQESRRSKLVVSFPVFRGGESEDVFHRQF